jgi:hypothetical protein
METMVQNYSGKTAILFQKVGKKLSLLCVYHILDIPNTEEVEEVIVKTFKGLALIADIRVERQGEKDEIPTNVHMVYVTRLIKEDLWIEPISPMELEFGGKKVHWKVKRSKSCYLCHNENHLDDVCPWKANN